MGKYFNKFLGGPAIFVSSNRPPLEVNKTWIICLFRLKNGVLSINCSQIHFDKKPICFKWKMTLLQMSKRPVAKLQGSQLQQTETGWSNVTAVCIAYLWRSQQGWTGPWRSWDDRSGPGNTSRHVHWKVHFDLLPVSDLYLTFCDQHWANGWKWCNPQKPQIHTHTLAPLYLSAVGHAPLPCEARVGERI